MLSKAIELIEDLDPFEFFKKTDAELVNDLKKMGSFQNEIVTRLKYRNLFKQAYTISGSTLDKSKMQIIEKLEKLKPRREKEQLIENTLNIPNGHIIIDIPSYELHQAEPRIDQTEVPIVDGDETKILDDYTPIAKAIKSREIPEWKVMIITDDKYRKIVSEKAEELLF
jgi:HD superfamily phosphohydrolase